MEETVHSFNIVGGPEAVCVDFTLTGEANVWEILEAFKSFLTAVGYCFEEGSEIAVVTPDDEEELEDEEYEEEESEEEEE